VREGHCQDLKPGSHGCNPRALPLSRYPITIWVGQDGASLRPIDLYAWTKYAIVGAIPCLLLLVQRYTLYLIGY